MDKNKTILPIPINLLKTKFQEFIGIIWGLLAQIVNSGLFVVFGGSMLILLFLSFSLYWFLLKLKIVK